MIVRRVSTRGSFGVLDFKWDAELPDFGRFNLIYGWNRSGKTTLSRILAACEKKSADFAQYPKDGDFEVLTGAGSRTTVSNLDTCDLAVRVFNQDFVDENVSFDSSACQPIVYISEEDIASKEQLDALNSKTEELATQRNAAQKEREAAEKVLAEFLEATALNVKNTVGSLKVADQYRSYDKGKLKNLLKNAAPASFLKLSEEAFEAHKSVIGSDPKPSHVEVSSYELHAFAGDREVTDLNTLGTIVREVVGRQVAAETLDRLKKDPQLNTWVKSGLDLQKERGELETCPYCEKPLDPGFLERLSRHFSEDYEALQEAASACLSALRSVEKERLESGADLYPEFTKPYRTGLQSLNKLTDDLNKWIAGCCEKLQTKLESPLSSIAPPTAPPRRFRERYDALVDGVNAALGEHNAKAANHGDEVRDKKDKLAEHIVAVAVREQGYGQMVKDVADATARETEAATSLNDHNDAIARLTRRTSNVGKAVEKINADLNDFFGRDEIQLELDAEAKGYAIKREGRIARNLSEGEKTAIAFSYFLAKVQERSFAVRDGVVVIDDPVSSLDSNFIFHCFSLVQGHFKSSGQLFVLTHNFELFSLTKSWFTRRNAVRRRDGKADCCCFYTVENRITSDVRRAYLAPMDATLRDFNSEYQYLFSRLKRFADQDSPGYEDLYTVGNVARRFLEIFAGFKIPTTGDLRSKVEKLPTPTVTDTQKDRVYRLVQEHSHGGDPTSAVVHKDKGESQEAVRILLKVVEEADPLHYALLARSVPA